jgi:hypothetical protein
MKLTKQEKKELKFIIYSSIEIIISTIIVFGLILLIIKS